MASVTTQLEGVIKMGADKASAEDVSLDVFSLQLVEERATNTRRPRFGDASEGEKAGAYRAMFAIEFEEDLDPSISGAHKNVTTAIRTDSSEMFISGQLKPGTIDATNPVYEATVIVSSVSTGGEVGSELEQSHTWTVKDGKVDIITTPPV